MQIIKIQSSLTLLIVKKIEKMKPELIMLSADHGNK